MGNTCCCCSCSAPDQVDYQDIFDKVIQVEDMDHINELISYIEQLLTAIDRGNIQSIARLAKTNRVAASLNSSDGLLEKILKRSKHVCKRNIVPNLKRETRKLVIDVANQGAQIKWVGVALSVVGFVLERIEQVSSNRDECIVLLKYMFNLAKYIKQLEDHLGNQEKLNRVLQFVVEGSLLCISQMQSHPLSKFFAAPVTADDLQNLRRGLGEEYSELEMESIIVVLNRIPAVLPPSQGRTPQAVGIEEATNSVIELLDMKVQSLKTVVICGHGGIGKTTLAETVFSKLDLQNYKYCKVYLEQNCSAADLKVAQQQILRDLYGRNIALRDLNEGREQLSKYLKEQSSKPVFIFVDNALEQKHLEKLLPISDLASLPPHSRILLTTRNLNETRRLSQAGVERRHYQVPCLPQDKAREILCELALDSADASFDPTIDINGLLEICQGIPLVLKMAGPRLREHRDNVAACRERVEYLKAWLLGGEEGELSERMVDFVYNRLDASCKEAFLDIVFFLCNWKRKRVVSSVGATEFEELQSAALVNVTDEGRVNVHDIVKARGRMMSRDGERITDSQSLTDALRDEESIKKIKGIALNESFELEAHHLNMMKRSLRVLSLTGNTRIINGECRGAFENLRLLSIENHNNYSWMDVSKHPRLSAIILTNVPDIDSEDSNVPEFAATIPSSLRYVYIEGVRLTDLITTLYQVQSVNCLTIRLCSGFDSLPESISNLFILKELNLRSCSSLGSLPNSFGHLSCLQDLDLGSCSSLGSLPDSFGSLSCLQDLNLASCSSLGSLPDSFGSLSCLQYLNLRSCSSLGSLPDSFGSLSCLQHLYLNSCSSLGSLPDSFGSLSCLQDLNLSSCSSLGSLPDSFGSLSCLQHLDLRSCSSLGSLPDSFGSLSCLQHLSLNSCSSLGSLPESFGSLSCLQYLDLSSCSSLGSLPDSFGSLSCLQHLDLSSCSSLGSLPDSFGSLSCLQDLNLSSCSSLGSLPDSFGSLSCLQHLDLRSCSSLGSLPDSFGSLSCLQDLSLSSCSSLGSLPESFGSLSCLQYLDLSSCSSLGSLPDSFGSLSCLQHLDLSSCSSLGSLPDSFGSLSCLQHLSLSSCSSLGSLPDSFGSLSCLQYLYLRSCSSLGSLPDSFGSLSCLERLHLGSCSSLGSLPDSFGSLSCLRDLDLSSCSSLGSLPDSFGSLSCLQYLCLDFCSSLGSLPDSFGSLSCLQYLNLSSCSSLGSLPDSFGSLSCLQSLNLSSCSYLGSLPDSFGSLSCLQGLNLISCSSLGSLPDSFGSLSCLQDLNLSSCSSLGSLPDSFGSLSCLRHLKLNSCSSLGSLPDSFGSLSCLQHLYLNSCSSLGSLPDSFGSLSCLQGLYLSSCSSLGSLPDSFGSLYKLLKLYLVKCTQLSLLPESFGNLTSLERLELQDCEKLMNLPQNFGQLKYLEYVSMEGCGALQSLSGDFECLSSLTAVKASECSQLEENTIDTLAKMKGLMVVDIDKSPKLKERWEQVKEHYSLAVVERGRERWSDEIYPDADVMSRAFFHSESKFVHVNENGQLGEWPSPGGGVKLWVLLKERDVTSSASSNSRRWEAVKKKWMEAVASEGGQMIFVDVGGSWEEREMRVEEALPHLPSGTVAWMPPDNRSRILFAHSVRHYYERHIVEKKDDLGVGNCIVSTSVWADEEGRRRLDLDHLQFILHDLQTPPLAESEYEDIPHQLVSPIRHAIKFLQYGFYFG